MNSNDSNSAINPVVEISKEDAPRIEAAGNSLSKRKFIKKSVVACLSIIFTAEAARRVALNAARREMESLPSNNIGNGEKVLKNRKYVVMTDEEKQAAVSSIIDNYQRTGGK